ncbi:MAG: hypothetical protein ACR2PI_07675 [Hyphomicrobiaceae bacterium]
MFKKTAIVVGFGVAVWAFCGALVGVGRPFMAMDMTWIVRAVGAPVGAAIASWFYFRNFFFTRPLATALIFVAISLVLDVLIVALLIEKSFDMFSSFLGFWLPQALIFSATYSTGKFRTPEPGSILFGP